MPLRYRRTVRLVPGLRLNFAKGGTSLSVGERGFTKNFGPRGTRTTIGLPGTGLSYTWRGRIRRRRGSFLGGLLILVLLLIAVHALFR